MDEGEGGLVGVASKWVGTPPVYIHHKLSGQICEIKTGQGRIKIMRLW